MTKRMPSIQEGYQDYLKGRKFDDNPYGEDEDDYHTWNDGWEVAHTEAELTEYFRSKDDQ